MLWAWWIIIDKLIKPKYKNLISNFASKKIILKNIYIKYRKINKYYLIDIEILKKKKKTLKASKYIELPEVGKSYN